MSDMPMGWVNVALQDCAALNPRHKSISPRTTVSFVPMPAVSDIDGEIESAQDRPFSEVSKGYTHFQTGDVIFAKITPCMENGKIAVARKLTGDLGCGSTEFHVLRPFGEVSPDFIWRFLRQKSFRADAEAAMTGAVGQRRVPLNYLKTQMLPLPPLNEQRRIVATIDSLSAKSRRARDRLDHIPRLVEKYKQAILAAAYEGKLVGNIKAPTLPIREMIASLDQGWSPKCEGEPASDPEDWAVMKTTAIQPIHFNGAENKKLPARLTPRPLIAIEPEDVLITRAGPRSRVAIACVVKKTRQRLMLCDKAYRMRVKPAVTNATFLALMLNAPQSLEKLEQMKTGISDSGLNLTQGKFLDLPIPNFSFVYQQEIVRRIGSAFTWIDRLASKTTGARKLIDHLDQAILAKAFRGELVPQDPSDEPASVLLERIGAGRLATPILRSRSTKKNTSRAATKPDPVRRRRRL
jgi:type I restriction enzyme, S subunit